MNPFQGLILCLLPIIMVTVGSQWKPSWIFMTASNLTVDAFSSVRKHWAWSIKSKPLKNYHMFKMMKSSSSSARTLQSQYNLHRFSKDTSISQIDPCNLPQFRYNNILSYGFKLSALSNEIQWDDMHSGGHNRSAPHTQRPFPPTLSDPTSYEEGFGGYGYDNSLDAYDQAEEQKQHVNVSLDPNEMFSRVEEDSATYRRQPGKSPSNSKGARPPVHISMPSLSDSKISERIVPYVPADSAFVAPDFDFTIPLPDSVSPSTIKEEMVDEPSMNLVNTYATASPSESLIPSTHFHAGQTLSGLQGYDPALDQFLSKAAYGVGATTTLDELQGELMVLEDSIYEQNNQCKFNINSPKQVAMALFGEKFGNSSTNKDVLEGMAGAGNRLAALILQYRATKYKLAKFTRQQESRAKGTAVRSALTVARPKVAKATIAPIHDSVPDPSVSQEKVITESSNVQVQTIMADPLLLLDASAYIFRAYYSMPPIHRPDGMPTGAVMGFCKMLNSLLLNRMLDGQQPRLVLCFDAKGKTFRHELFKEYKGNRAAAPMDLVPQFDLVRQAAKAYGICQIEAYRFEADDVIATLACRATAEGVDANIMSGDKDLMQLVTELDVSPSVQIIDPMKKERTTYAEVVEKWEVPPQKLGDVLALAGDTADNVPGVRGIGPKTAAKLINEFGSLENLLNNINDVKQRGIREKLLEDEANARLSRTLVELNRSVPMDELIGLPDGVNQKMGDLRMEVIDPDRIIDFYDQMGFKELKRTFQNSLKGLKLKKKSSSYNKRPKATIPTPEDYKDVPF